MKRPRTRRLAVTTKHGGEYVIELHPATESSEALVAVREKGRRLRYYIGVGALHSLLAMRAAGMPVAGRGK